ncbi:MAG: transposase [Opitutales bacterium]
MNTFMEEEQPESLRWRYRLPHWDLGRSGTYFLTLRCAGSLPAEVVQRLADLKVRAARLTLKDAEVQQLERLRFLTLDNYLDQHRGFSPFKQRAAAEKLADVLKEGCLGWGFPVWVIMPNHIHLLARPAVDAVPLKRFIQRFKGMSARLLNLSLNRSGRFWQQDTFDRWIRSALHLRRTRNYIRKNPEKAGLGSDYPWVSQETDEAFEKLVRFYR